MIALSCTYNINMLNYCAVVTKLVFITVLEFFICLIENNTLKKQDLRQNVIKVMVPWSKCYFKVGIVKVNFLKTYYCHSYIMIWGE